MGLLSISQINENLAKIPDWNLEDNGKSVMKIFEFKDFSQAVSFINRISEIAEREQHHPNLRLYNYNKLEVNLSTHSLNGLTEKDFTLAMKIEELIQNAEDKERNADQ